MSDTASFKFQQAMAELKETLLTIGQEIMPMVSSAVEFLSDAFANVSQFIKGLPDPVKNTAIALTVFAAAAGPAALALGALTSAGSALMANPMVLTGAIVFGTLATAIGLAASQSREAKERVQSLREEFEKVEGSVATVVPTFETLIDTIGKLFPDEQVDELGKAIDQITGRATIDAAIMKADLSEAFNAIGFDMGLLAKEVTSGGQSFDNFSNQIDDAVDRAYKWEQANAAGLNATELAAGKQEYLTETLRAAGVEINENTQKLIDNVIANDYNTESARNLANELGSVEVAFKTLTAETEAEAKALLESADTLTELRKVYGDNTLAVIDRIKAEADAIDVTEENTYVLGVLNGMLEEVARESAWAAAEIAGFTYESDSLNDVAIGASASLEDMVAGFLAGGEAAGFTVDQMRAVSEQLKGIDGFTAAVGVELDLIGGDAVLKAIDALIKLQMEGMSGLSPDAAQFGFGGALGDLMAMRDALAEALANPDSGGRGGGGGSGASNAVDEVARAAEEAERELQRLIQGVDQFGSSMMGRDFVESLFGGSPDEIADIFEDLVSQFDELGMLADGDFASAIANLGEQFKLAAQKANDLAEATEALAAAQDELERRKAVLSDLKDEYAEFREEFNVSDKQFRIAGKKNALEIALDGIEKNLPKLRDAQNELDRLKSEKGSFEEQVRGMFAPSLSPDSNVMGQTQRILGQAREFRDNLIKLRDKGFPPDVIAEVVNAGLAGGAKIGRQLLRMGTGEMSEFLQMRAEIARLGAETASIAGEVIFGADIANAKGEVDRLVGVVQALYKNAIAEAKKEVDAGKSSVDSLTDALTAATAQMATLVDNIQVNLFNAFNNFLSKLSGEVTTLTTTPVGLSLDTTAIDRLTNLIAKVTDTTPPPSSGGGGSTGGGGGSITPTPAPAPAPEQTYTVKSGDGPIAIIKALTGSTSGWSSKASKLWKHNGMFWNSSKDWQTIHAGQVLRVPALAKGGKARAGMPHLVGEMGAELFVPDSSGYVVPNHALGGDSQTVNVTINTHAGMRAEDIVREIEKYTRRRGQVSIPTTGNRRF
jgi:hypothetical protein